VPIPAPTTTIVGNLARDPELRFSQKGNAIVGFTVAYTPRRFDKNTDGWVDGTTLWLRCTAFGPLAENIAERVGKGDKVTVTGKLQQNDWEDKDGTKRSTIELLVDEAGLALSKTDKTARGVGPREAASSSVDAPW